MASSATTINPTANGAAMAEGLPREERETETSTIVSKEHDLVLQTIRLLISDLCQQFGGGHPGGAIGMAAIGVALWKYVMRYAPHTPNYFDRDRYVLSNGAFLYFWLIYTASAGLFHYCFLHLAGYRNMTSAELRSWKRWADASFSMKSFGHILPESTAYQYFGFTRDQMAGKVVGYLDDIKSGHLFRGEFT